MKSLNRFMIWEIKSGHLFMCGCGLCACSFIWIISVQHGFYFSVYSFIPRWLPIQLVRFCLFVWDVVICFIYLAVFFWKLVNGALYAHICAGSVRICAIDSNRREEKKSQRFYITLYLLLFLYLYKRDDALNVLLLDKNETFCLLILI